MLDVQWSTLSVRPSESQSICPISIGQKEAAAAAKKQQHIFQSSMMIEKWIFPAAVFRFQLNWPDFVFSPLSTISICFNGVRSNFDAHADETPSEYVIAEI